MADTATRVAPARTDPRTILAVVGFGVFVAADDLTVVSTMLRPIIGDLGLVLPEGLDDAAWIVNVYLIAYLAVMPVAGRVSDVIGRRRTFALAYAVFLAGSIVIPLTSSLETFLVGRVLTAIGGGAMVPVAMAVVGDAFERGPRARALGTLGAIDTLGWVWGPLYGAMLVRFLSWRWQFWLNVPLAVAGLAAAWWALADHDTPRRGARVDWIGAAAMTAGLIALNLALLGNTEIQSVSGFDELSGGTAYDFRWLYAVAAAAAAVLVWRERRSPDPLVDRSLLAGRNVRVALAVNLVVGATLIIAMVDVPLFVNAVEVDVEESAVVAGWVLSALTASMAAAAYAGGRWTQHRWYGPPVVAGMLLASGAYLLMGWTWDASTPYAVLGAQLAMLGVGFGLVIAPTTSAVVDGAPPDRRGAAASLVMVLRLLGLSIGLSALTAWGLARFNALRGTIELPDIDDPGFEDALREAQRTLTATSIADTFLAAGAVAVVGLGASLLFRRRAGDDADGDTTYHGDGGVMNEGSDEHVEDTGEPTTTLPAVVAEPPTGEQSAARARSGHGLRFAVAALGVLLAAAIVAIALLFVRLQDTEDDLERVEAGTAVFAAQVQGLAGGLGDAGPELTDGLDAAIAGLEEFRSSTLTFDVAIDETVSLDTELAIDREITIPIDETVPIETTFDTTIEVDAPFGLTVPVDVSVPVDVDVPLQLDVAIPVNETIPIATDVPVSLDVPVTVDVADTELAALAASLEEGLRAFRDLVADIGG